VAGSALGFTSALGIGGLLVGAPFITILLQARKLAKAGYGLEDLRLAVREDAAQREEEIRFEFGRTKGVVARIARPVMTVSLLAIAGSAGLGAWFPAGGRIAWPVFAVSFLTFGVSGVIVARRHGQTRDVWGKRAVKFWMSRLGGWLYRLAARGVARGVPATGVTHRPTELAIGLAAERLYQELPKPLRAELGDLPQIVRRLEADAQAMRARVEELNALLAQAGDSRTEGAADRRTALRDRLETERETAEGQMRDAVVALETVRLNLLRMHAGVADAASVTADLEAAREVSAAVARLAEGQREVERMLGR
jgi:serine/threonine-protein kinase